MVLLEAWNQGVPALVNARCVCSRARSKRADGGLHYANVREFCEGLELLVREPDLARTLGAQGRAYVDREYRWPVVMDRLESLLAHT